MHLPHRRLPGAITIFCGVALAVGHADADTLLVPSDYPTIQAGLDAALDGECVLVAPGTYQGEDNRNLDFHGRSIILRSEGGRETCTIDCENEGRGFYFANNETYEAVVQGFTIERGLVTPGSDGGNAGAGIYCSGSSPTIVDCLIRDSHTQDGFAGSGAGLYFRGSWSSVVDCVVSGNSTGSGAPDGGDGGGVGIVDSVIEMTRCDIETNATGSGTAGRGGNGAGVHCRESLLFMRNSTVRMNVAGDGAVVGGSGGGLYAVDSVLSIADVDILDNTAGAGLISGDGGGAHATGCTGGFIECDIWNNTALADGEGGGAYVVDSTLDIIRCSFECNVASSGAGMVSCDAFTNLSECMFSANRAAARGGGFYCMGGAPELTLCGFDANEAILSGGGMEVGTGTPCVEACIFTSNQVLAGVGGGLSAGGSPVVVGGSFQSNTAAAGGGIFVPLGSEDASLSLSGTVFFDDNVADLATGILNQGTILAEGLLDGVDEFVNLGALHVGAGKNLVGDLEISLGFRQREPEFVSGTLVTDVGDGHDLLTLSGQQDLDGAIQVELLGAFPGIGYEIEIISGPSVFGRFDVGRLPGASDRVMTVGYESGGDGMAPVRIEVGALGLPLGFGEGELFDIPAGAAWDMVLDDFDADSFLDLALVLSGGGPEEIGSLVVLFNEGEIGGEWQGFGAVLQFPTGRGPVSVTSGQLDLENDETESIDLAVANLGDNAVWRFRNDLERSGEFVHGSNDTFVFAEAPVSVVAVNIITGGQMLDDLIVLTDGFVEVLEQVTPGEFMSTGTNVVRTGSARIRPQDVGDNKCLDLVVSSATEGGDNEVGVLIQDGDGTFQPAQYFPVDSAPGEPGPVHLAHGDFDGDGDLDTITANTTANTISVLLNRGNDAEQTWLGFEPALSLEVATHPRSMVVALVDQDGDPDVAIIGGDPAAVQIIRNDGGDGEGNFAFSVLDPIEDESIPLLITAGDVDNDGFPDLVTASGLGAGPSGGGVNVFRNALGDPESCVPFAVPDENGVLYVDADAREGGMGASWEDAITDLRTALCRASIDSQPVLQIWVAAGTYAPASAGGNRADAFELTDGVSLYGHFAGGETTIEERDLSNPANTTTLTGDLNGDDDEAGNAENSYHVIVALEGVGVDTVLDGFEMRAGNADGPGVPLDRGGGMYSFGGSPTIRHCVFTSNESEHSGGGLFLERSHAVFFDCEISNNTVADGLAGPGGGLNFIGCPEGCVSAPKLVDCRITGNRCGSGGGFSESWSSPILVNCIIAGNVVNKRGGAITSGQNSMPVLRNCVVTDNHDAIGHPGLWIQGDGGGGVALSNTIVWGNGEPGEGQIFVTLDPLVVVSNCCVEGGPPEPFVGCANIDEDPLFADTDYRLDPASPCIDAGHAWGVGFDAADLDVDGDTDELSHFDLDGQPRFADSAVAPDTGCGDPAIPDMGPYEAAGEPNEPVFADLTGDGLISFADILEVIKAWGACQDGCCLQDLTLDCDVDFLDLLVVLGRWTGGR